MTLIDKFWKLFKDHGVVVEGHFIFTTGLHSNVYFDKDTILAKPELAMLVCHEMVRLTEELDYDVVIGPATGGIVLAWEVARLRSAKTGRSITPLYAILKEGEFVPKGRTGQFLEGKTVLITEDVLTTGWTTRQLIAMVRKYGGNVVGVVSILNRGEVSADDLDIPILRSVVTQSLPAWQAPCPQCEKGVPIDPELGHDELAGTGAFATGAGP